MRTITSTSGFTAVAGVARLAPRPLVAVVVGLALVLCPPPAPASAQAQNPTCDWSVQPPYSDFYSPPPLGTLSDDRLGEVLRVEHLASYTPAQVAVAAGVPYSLYGAEAYRILYLSQDPPGSPRAISGLLLAATGPRPAAGFPVIIDGHPTVGAADQCAPSARGLLRVEALLIYVAAGYTVTATDYVGLGTTGPHPYAVGEPAARSLLDAARAARRFCDAAHGISQQPSGAMLLEGHSQGGHAVLFAQQLWKSYAPELDIRGTIAFAPGSEPLLLAQKLAQSAFSPLVEPVALAMYSMSRYYGAPASAGSWLQEPYASELPGRFENECFVSIGFWLGLQPRRVFQTGLLDKVAAGQWDEVKPWKQYMDANTPGNFGSTAPVLIIQGGADPLVPLAASEALQRRLCTNGTNAKLSVYKNRGHDAPGYSMPEALTWAGARIAGLPAASNCMAPRLFVPRLVR